MYKLKFGKRKQGNNNLYLYKDRKYVIGKRVEGYPTLNDVLILQNRSGLSINWFGLWEELIKTNDKCQYCGKPIENEPFTIQKLYCSIECQKNYYREKDANYRFSKRIRKRNDEYFLLNQYVRNYGPLPEGFTEIDDLNELGNTQLTKHIKRKTDGTPDWEEEKKAIKNEKKRILGHN